MRLSINARSIHVALVQRSADRRFKEDKNQLPAIQMRSIE